MCPTRRALVTTAVAFILLLSTPHLINAKTTTLSLLLSTMTSSPSSIPISVHLSSSLELPPTTADSDSGPGSAKLRITLRNTSPHPVSILRWASPLDEHVSARGVVRFTSTATGEAARSVDILVNRRMPSAGYFLADDRESIVNIPAGGQVDEVVVFGEPEVRLVSGEEYKVRAEGWWMGVWVREDEGAKLTIGEGMRTGEFQSNEIVVRVPGYGEL